MKTRILTTVLTVIFATSTNAASSSVKLTCGNKEVGKAIEFVISPLQRTVSYEAVVDGNHFKDAFGPTSGIYDKSWLDFTGGEFLSQTVNIHGDYWQYLRINHFSSITIDLEKDANSDNYKLKNFSSKYEITSSFEPTKPETIHEQFIGLECALENA